MLAINTGSNHPAVSSSRVSMPVRGAGVLLIAVSPSKPSNDSEQSDRVFQRSQVRSRVKSWVRS